MLVERLTSIRHGDGPTIVGLSFYSFIDVEEREIWAFLHRFVNIREKSASRNIERKTALFINLFNLPIEMIVLGSCLNISLYLL